MIYLLFCSRSPTWARSVCSPSSAIPPPPLCISTFRSGMSRCGPAAVVLGAESRIGVTLMMIIYPRETPPHTRTARAQPPAAHRHRHSRPHHRRHGEHSPTARQPHSNGLCSPPTEGPGPGSALRHVEHFVPVGAAAGRPLWCWGRGVS